MKSYGVNAYRFSLVSFPIHLFFSGISLFIKFDERETVEDPSS